MCGYFCITFIGFMLKEKSLLGYGNFFSPNRYEKINKIMQKYIIYWIFKNPKSSYTLGKTLSAKMKMKKN